MAPPISSKRLSTLLARPIDTQEDYDQALKTLQTMQEMGIMLEYIKTFPAEAQAEVMVYADPTLTDEQRQKRLDDIENMKSSGMMAGVFGGYEDVAQETRIAPPLEAASKLGTGELLRTAAGRQQTIGPYRAGLERPTTYDARATLQNQLEEAFSGLDDVNKNANVTAALNAFDKIKSDRPTLSDREVYDETLDLLKSMDPDKIETAPADKLDPRTKQKYGEGTLAEMFANAVDFQAKTGQDLPLYTERQYDFFSDLQAQKYNSVISKHKTELETEGSRENKSLARKGMGRVTLEDGRKVDIPYEVIYHLANNPLTGTIYDPKFDTQIIKAYKEGRVSQFAIPGDRATALQSDLRNDRRAIDALAKVKAYEELGVPDWRKDFGKRKEVLENLTYFDEQGVFVDKTALGGTTETTVSWVLRNAFSPLSAVAATATTGLNYVGGYGIGVGAEGLEKLGVIPEADYIDPDYTRRLREEERPPLYQGYGLVGEIADNIARFKGFTGEGIAISEEMNLEGLEKWGTIGGYFILDLADPTFDIGTGAVSGLDTFYKTQKVYKSIHGASNYDLALKAAKQAFLEEQPLVLGAQALSKRFGSTMPDNLQTGDVLLTMSDNVSRNLTAERIVKNGGTADDLKAANVFDTEYAQQYTKALSSTEPNEAATIASTQFRKGLRENPKTAQMLDSYDDSADMLQRVARVDPSKQDDAIKLIKSKGKYKNADVDGIKKALKSVPVDDANAIATAQKNLDTLYGRAMFFEYAPDLKALEKVSWFTPNTLVHQSRRPHLTALASRTDVAKALNTVIDQQGGKAIFAQRPSREVAYDVFNTGVKSTDLETKTAYSLDKLAPIDQEKLLQAVESVDLTPTRRQAILDNIVEDKVLFVDDANHISNLNRDMVARFDSAAATIEDINRMTAARRSELLEGAGTVDRKVGLRSAVKEQVSRIFDPKGYKQRKAIVNQLDNPIAPTKSTMAFEQQRLLTQHKTNMGMLPMRSQDLFRKMQRNDGNILSRYLNEVPKRKLTPPEILGLMIVGEKKSNLGQVINARNQLRPTIQFLLDNLFHKKKQLPSTKFSQADKMLGLDDVYTTGLWNKHGLAYIEQKLKSFEFEVMLEYNPLDFWVEIRKLVDDLNDAIQNPNNRTRTVKVHGGPDVTKPIVPEYINSDNVAAITDEIFSDRFANIGIPTYYAAESNRIMADLLSDTFESSLTKLSVKSILPNVKIEQNIFESLVKERAIANFLDPNASDFQSTINQYRNMVAKGNMQFDAALWDKDLIKALDQNKLGIELSKRYQTRSKEVLEEATKYKQKVYDANDIDTFVKKEIKERITPAFDEQVGIIKRIKDEDISILKAKVKDANDRLIKRDVSIDSAVVKQYKAERDNAIKKVTDQIEKAEKLSATSKAEKARKKKFLKTLKDRKKVIEKKANKAYNDKIKALKEESGKNAIYSPKVQQALNRNERYLQYHIKRIEEDFQKNKKIFERNKKINEQDVRKKYARLLDEAIDNDPYQANRKIADSSSKVVKANIKLLKEAKSLDELLRVIKNLEVLAPELKAISTSRSNAMKGLNSNAMRDIFNAADDYAKIILRNNNLSYGLTKGNIDDIVESLDDLFKDSGYASAVFGRENYLQMKNEISTLKEQYGRTVINAVQKNPEQWLAYKKAFNVINNSLYVMVLGLNPASHVRNTVTAPTIVYQTTGLLLGAKDTTRGLNVVRHGRNLSSRDYSKIVLRTKDGQAYTNGDLFRILQQSGVRNQFQFIEAQLREGSPFAKEIDRLTNKHIGTDALTALKTWMVEKPLYLQTMEDFTFRAGVLIKALEDGRSVDEAASLARRSMFDYSDMPENWTQAARSVLVFSSFTYQNVTRGIKALRDPESLARYGRMLRAIKSSNAILRSNNDNKQLPYEMYYPLFAQNRLVYELNQYGDNISFAMAPAVPAIDSINAVAGFLSVMLSYPLGYSAKDVVPLQPMYNLLSPIVKEIFPLERKYEGGKAKVEIINLLTAYNDAQTPNEIAGVLERFAGGRVYPRPAKEGEKGAYNGYVYPLSKAQRKKLYHENALLLLFMTGAYGRISDYYRLTNSQGTTLGSLPPLQRALALSGLISVSQTRDPDIQQARNLSLKVSELDKLRKASETSMEAAFIRDTELIQPSDEGVEDGKNR